MNFFPQITLIFADKSQKNICVITEICGNHTLWTDRHYFAVKRDIIEVNLSCGVRKCLGVARKACVKAVTDYRETINSRQQRLVIKKYYPGIVMADLQKF